MCFDNLYTFFLIIVKGFFREFTMNTLCFINCMPELPFLAKLFLQQSNAWTCEPINVFYKKKIPETWIRTSHDDEWRRRPLSVKKVRWQPLCGYSRVLLRIATLSICIASVKSPRVQSGNNTDIWIERLLNTKQQSNPITTVASSYIKILPLRRVSSGLF